MPKQNVVIYNPSRFDNEAWLPALWSQAKTYYERHGIKKDQWNWVPCYADIYSTNLDRVQQFLLNNPPDVFAISLYVWNYSIAHEVAQWVKQQWPKCFILSGGPHQYFKHSVDWFVQHPYIDASLPGECYGEQCFLELLDNLNHGNIDFDLVTDLCYPQGRTRLPTHSIRRSNRISKKNFDYNWPSFADQRTHIEDYISYAKSLNSKTKLLAILETTRGCPYGCTYCDWGGGIATTVVKKDLEIVKQDIDFLAPLGLEYLYIADANFGIFGERDVAIAQYLADVQHSQPLPRPIKLGYGGFAKTENKIDYIRQIATIDVENELSSANEIKISMQSLDHEVLDNIDRKNISLEKQLEIFQPLSRRKRWPLYVEMILGLPGMTLEKFYQELSVLGQHNLSVLWFEWLLLPETPASNPEYIEKYQLTTVKKTQGWSTPQQGSEHHVVIESHSYSRRDYLEMLLATSWYHAIVRGGLFERSIQHITKSHTLGTIIKTLIDQHGIPDTVITQWNQILENPDRPCQLFYGDHAIYPGYWAIAESYFNTDAFLKQIGSILATKFRCPSRLIAQDISSTVTSQDITWVEIHSNFALYKNSGHILTKHSVLTWLKNILKFKL